MSPARHRPRVLPLAVFAVVGCWWLLAGPPANAVEPSAPTVTFIATGAPPVACGTRPDLSSLSVPEGTAIVVANRTGVPTNVVVGGATVLTVAHDEGASLRLAAGQHEVRLVPECESIAANLPLTVSVSSAAPAAPSSSGPPASSPGGDSPAPGAAAGGGSGQTTSAAGGGQIAAGGAASARPTATDAQASTPPSPSGSASPQPTDAVAGPGSSLHPAVLEVATVDLDGTVNPKGVRLLAAIATICVLGVTAAIIRSIVRLDA